MMYCCLLSSKTSSISGTQNEEKKPLLKSGTIINYRTPLTVPYQHVIRNDKIQLESSNVFEVSITDTLLFNGTMPDGTSQTRSLSFDDDDTNPTVSATTGTNGHCLLERLFTIHNVTAVNSSTKIAMSPIKSTKTNLSNTVPMARPFDEFSTGVTSIPTSPLGGQSFGTTDSGKD